MGKRLADQAKRRPKKRRPKAEIEPVRKSVVIVDQPSSARNEFTAVQMMAIQMIARGELLPDVARRLQYHLVPHEPSREKRMKKARIRLRRWFQSAKFRDALWEESVVGLDLDSPRILQGVSKKARAGRVDAARLALEITGRHAPNAEVTPATITINFDGLPRPDRELPMAGDTVDADEEIEDAEFEDV